ncbi:hypothetical protein HMPREF1316_2440 [Olsenella profusa F0195]|uniref:Uncharacterized protein n=1 Tax=Olsenella profusa F0195 TaxID=1125712 RepID=U2V4N2_9ACTN|nr:hypothetical protein HMPREF1316_2440 [Olsenella profusa F0195]
MTASPQRGIGPYSVPRTHGWPLGHGCDIVLRRPELGDKGTVATTGQTLCGIHALPALMRLDEAPAELLLMLHEGKAMLMKDRTGILVAHHELLEGLCRLRHAHDRRHDGNEQHRERRVQEQKDEDRSHQTNQRERRPLAALVHEVPDHLGYRPTWHQARQERHKRRREQHDGERWEDCCQGSPRSLAQQRPTQP